MFDFTPEEYRIMDKAIDFYGADAQIDKAIQEMAKLTQALLSHRLTSQMKYADKAVERVAEVAILLQQIIRIYEDCGCYADAYGMAKQKLEALGRRVDK